MDVVLSYVDRYLANGLNAVGMEQNALFPGDSADFRNRLAYCTITMFRRLDGVWHRSDVKIQERCYAPKEIDTALRNAGFGEILCYDAHDLGMAGQLGEGRTFYIATRI